ncbi:MAG: sigma-70 family RNA polymerase sigma factor [Balneolaceae bacterium]
MAEPISILSISIEDQIIRRLRERDSEAISLIFEHYSLAMFNSINQVLKNKMLSEDVLQEVLVKVWEKGNTYDATRGSLYTWLIRVSKNAAIDKTRGKEFIRDKKSNSIDSFVFNDKAANQAKKEDGNADLWETVDQLPENQRSLIDMAYFRGFTQKEIAKEMDIPLGTVKTRMRNALLTLRRIF